jgi:hypothetical protein
VNKHNLDVAKYIAYLPVKEANPLFSINDMKGVMAVAPIPAVKLSPIAATTSMSPGISLCTLVGLFEDLKDRGEGHGKGPVSLNCVL